MVGVDSGPNSVKIEIEMIHIIVPTFNRPHHVKTLWEGLQSCGVPNTSTKILFTINGEDEKTKAYLAGLSPAPTILQCPQGTAAKARNYALSKTPPGEWVLFLDDDVQLPQDYFTRAMEILQREQPDVLGGPDIAPSDATSLQKAYGFCQGHPLVTGHTYRRHCKRASKVQEASECQLSLCHLWIKREIFEQGLNFPDNYPRNEENVLLHQLQTAGKKILYAPDLAVIHYKKETLGKVISASFVSGQYRMKSFLDYPQSFDLLFLAPMALTLYLLLSLLLPLPDTPIALYNLLCLIVAGQCLFQEKQWKMALWTLVLIPIIHISYGMGTLWGYLNRSKIDIPDR